MIFQECCVSLAILACAALLVQLQHPVEGASTDAQDQLVDTAVKKCVKSLFSSGSFLTKKSYSDRTAADIFCLRNDGELIRFGPPFDIGTWAMSKSLAQFISCVQDNRELPKGTLTGLYALYQQLRGFLLKACSSRPKLDLNVKPEAYSTLFDPRNFNPRRKFTLFVINGIVADYFSGQSSVQKANEFFCKSGDSGSSSAKGAVAEFQTYLASLEEAAPLLANIEKTLKQFNEKMDSDLICQRTVSAAYTTLAKTTVTDCLLPFAALLMGDVEKVKQLEDPKKICEKKFYVFTTADLNAK